MRNAKRTGRMKKHTGMLMMTAILVCGLTACQGTEEAEDISSETLVTSEQESTNVADEETSAMEETKDVQGEAEQPGTGQNQQQGRYMGEITDMEENQITVNVMGGGQFQGGMPEGKMPEGEFFEGEMPENIQPAVKPEGAPEEGELPEGVEPGEKWEGSEPDEMPEGKTFEGMEQKEKPEGFEPGGMPEGETMVIEVSEDTIITLNEEIGEIMDLKVGDFIQFTMDGDLVTEINVGMPQQDDLQKETENAETTE